MGYDWNRIRPVIETTGKKVDLSDGLIAMRNPNNTVIALLECICPIKAIEFTAYADLKKVVEALLDPNKNMRNVRRISAVVFDSNKFNELISED